MVQPGMGRSVSERWIVQNSNEALIATLKGVQTGQLVASFRVFGDKQNVTCPF